MVTNYLNIDTGRRIFGRWWIFFCWRQFS